MNTGLFVRHRGAVVAGGFALAACCAIGVAAQGQQSTLPLTPQSERGASISPAYEGWYPNADGSFSLLLGYYNRNAKETLDIPVGPNNRVDPGGPDQGQPTHFEVGRQWGVFVVKVPKDFGTEDDHLDDRRQRRDAVHSVHPQQGISDQPVQGTGDGQPAAGPRIFAGRRESDRPADRCGQHLHRCGETADPDQHLGGGSQVAERGRGAGGRSLSRAGRQSRDHFAAQVPRARKDDLRQGRAFRSTIRAR